MIPYAVFSTLSFNPISALATPECLSAHPKNVAQVLACTTSITKVDGSMEFVFFDQDCKGLQVKYKSFLQQSGITERNLLRARTPSCPMIASVWGLYKGEEIFWANCDPGLKNPNAQKIAACLEPFLPIAQGRQLTSLQNCDAVYGAYDRAMAYATSDRSRPDYGARNCDRGGPGFSTSFMPRSALALETAPKANVDRYDDLRQAREKRHASRPCRSLDCDHAPQP